MKEKQNCGRLLRLDFIWDDLFMRQWFIAAYGFMAAQNHRKYIQAGAAMLAAMGYHKESAALADAITSAGIELYGDPYSKDNTPKRNKQPAHISGCGSTAATDALIAIAKAAGAIGECLIVRN